jgi:hypothetical protein
MWAFRTFLAFQCCWMLNAGIRTVSQPWFESAEDQALGGSGFVARAAGYSAVFHPNGSASYALDSSSEPLMMILEGARPANVSAAGRLEAVTRYYRGAQPGRTEGIPHYSRIVYDGLYPGIDLEWRARDHRLEYEFRLAAGAAPERLRIRFSGQAGLTIDLDGDLVVVTSAGELRYERPQAWQERNGRREAVPAQFRLTDGVVTFLLGAYDTGMPLTIDPVLQFSTYLGGAGFDAVYAVVADADGNVYVAGETASLDLPSASSGVRTTRAAYVSKLSADGSTVLFTTILDSHGNDSARALALDAAGNVWVTGIAGSSGFPVTGDALFGPPRGGTDVFVARLDSAGRLNYSTYLGGSGADAGSGIAVNSSGVYIVGYTVSVNFPTTSNALQTTFQGGLGDAFLIKLDLSGTALLYSTYLGGTGTDTAAAVALDSGGRACLAGYTNSLSLPLRNAMKAAPSGNGNGDVLLACLNASGSSWDLLTYLGGAGTEEANAIAFDSAGNLYLAGETNSADFPVTVAAYQKTKRADYDVFLMKISPGGTLIYSSLLGGNGSDSATALAVTNEGLAWIAGFTSSVDFPAAVTPAFAGSFDAFVAGFNADGSALTLASYLGGSGDDRALALTLAPGGAPIVAGMTNSTNYPVTAGALEAVPRASYNAFISRIKLGLLQVVSVSPSSGSGSSGTFSFTFTDSEGASDLGMVQAIMYGTTGGSCYVAVYPAGRTLVLFNDQNTALLGPITLGNAGTVRNSQCVVDGAGSSVTARGATLTVNLALSFSSGFAGAKTVAGYAQTNASVGSSWRTLGTWTVSITLPQVVSVSPASGTGGSGTFSFAFTDSSGASDLTMVQMLINGSLTAGSACYIAVFPPSQSVYLFNDTATALLGPGTMGVAGTLANSQCTLNPGGSSVTLSGTTLTVRLALTFPSGFAGAKNVYGYAQTNAGLGSGWQALGSWTVPLGGPQVVSVSPASGTGGSGTFSFAFTDSSGASDLAMVQMLINGTFTAASACYVAVLPPSRSVYLFNDTATALLGPGTMGVAGTLANSQCTLNPGGSSVTLSGTTLTVRLALTFPSGFAGAKNTYAYAQTNAGLGSSWQALGSWTVPPGGPQVVSVSPSSGSGSSGAFSFTFTDSAGASDLGMVQAIMYGSTGGSCYVAVYPAGRTLVLFNDQNTVLLGPITLGNAGTVRNSQCVVDGAGSSVTVSGSTLTVSLALSFSPGFAGAKTWAGYAQTNASVGSSWQTLGSWTVPGGP